MNQAFITTVRRATSGRWIAAGYYNYLGRSTDGVTFTGVQLPVQIQWFNDVASAGIGSWWAVGEKGTIPSQPE